MTDRPHRHALHISQVEKVVTELWITAIEQTEGTHFTCVLQRHILVDPAGLGANGVAWAVWSTLITLDENWRSVKDIFKTEYHQFSLLSSW